MKQKFIELKNGFTTEEAIYQAVVRNMYLLMQSSSGQIALNEIGLKVHNSKYPISSVSKKYLLEYYLITEDGAIHKDIKEIIKCTMAIKSGVLTLVNGIKNTYETMDKIQFKDCSVVSDIITQTKECVLKTLSFDNLVKEKILGDVVDLVGSCEEVSVASISIIDGGLVSKL